ncbi:MAG: type II toxin-antitoxin system PemK/MazF family toxin [Pyrinomonadaceae bacterium]
MGRFVKGDVVVVLFPFSDLSNAKKRPALVITHLNRNDAIVCQITTHNVGDGYSIELKNKDFTTGNLPKLSYIRPNRLFTVDTNIIEKRVGSLKKTKIDEVVSKIINIIS